MQSNDNSNARWLSLSDIMLDKSGFQPGPKELRNLALVLAARNVPYRQHPQKHPVEIFVPEQSCDIAWHEVSLYLDENDRTTPEKTRLVPAENVLSSISILLLLGIFHNLTYFQVAGLDHASIDWLRLGNADSAKILEGEWWRAVTSLTLHADGQHLMGNILIGGYFIVRLCQITKSGLGWALILGSGFLGNLVNALFQGSSHNAVGASTAIFGAIGIAGAIGSIQSHKQLVRAWILPLAAACLLLAFLGAGNGDSHTDIGAHFFGFACGALLGIPSGLFISRQGQPGRIANIAFSLFAITFLLGSWLLALTY